MLRSVSRQLLRRVPARRTLSADAVAAAPKSRVYRKGPWSNHDAWRDHPMLKEDRIIEIFPGLGKAIVLFGIYCGCEFAYNTIAGPPADDHHGHGGDDHQAHGAEEHHAFGGEAEEQAASTRVPVVHAYENSVSSTGPPTPKH